MTISKLFLLIVLLVFFLGCANSYAFIVGCGYPYDRVTNNLYLRGPYTQDQVNKLDDLIDKVFGLCSEDLFKKCDFPPVLVNTEVNLHVFAAAQYVDGVIEVRSFDELHNIAHEVAHHMLKHQGIYGQIWHHFTGIDWDETDSRYDEEDDKIFEQAEEIGRSL